MRSETLNKIEEIITNIKDLYYSISKRDKELLLNILKVEIDVILTGSSAHG